MSFGFPAYYREELILSDTIKFRELLEKALANLSYPILKKSKDQIILKVDWSVWSWGERINIDFSRPGVVTITSECAFPLQCIDYGKNKENVKKLIDSIH